MSFSGGAGAPVCGICGSVLKGQHLCDSAVIFGCSHRFCAACTGIAQRGSHCPLCAVPLHTQPTTTPTPATATASGVTTAADQRNSDVVSAAFQRYVNSNNDRMTTSPALSLHRSLSESNHSTFGILPTHSTNALFDGAPLPPAFAPFAPAPPGGGGTGGGPFALNALLSDFSLSVQTTTPPPSHAQTSTSGTAAAASSQFLPQLPRHFTTPTVPPPPSSGSMGAATASANLWDPHQTSGVILNAGGGEQLTATRQQRRPPAANYLNQIQNVVAGQQHQQPPPPPHQRTGGDALIAPGYVPPPLGVGAADYSASTSQTAAFGGGVDRNGAFNVAALQAAAIYNASPFAMRATPPPPSNRSISPRETRTALHSFAPIPKVMSLADTNQPFGRGPASLTPVKQQQASAGATLPATLSDVDVQNQLSPPCVGDAPPEQRHQPPSVYYPYKTSSSLANTLGGGDDRLSTTPVGSSISSMSPAAGGRSSQQRRTDAVLNHHHQPLPSTRQAAAAVCTSCGDGLPATSRCEQCNEHLCAGCVSAHLRVRVTREHTVMALTQQPHRTVDDSSLTTSSSSGQSPLLLSPPAAVVPQLSTAASSFDATQRNGGTAGGGCEAHANAPQTLLCTTCRTPLCVRCLQTGRHARHAVTSQHQDAQTAVTELLHEAQMRRRNLHEAHDAIRRIEERVEASVRAVSSEVQSVMRQYIGVLEERRRLLLQNVDTCRGVKVAALREQGERITAQLGTLNGSLDAVERFINSSEQDGGGDASKVFESLVTLLTEPVVSLQPRETDELAFVKPDGTILERLRDLGTIRTTACSKTSSLVGDSFKRAIKHREYQATVQLRDPMGEPCGETDRVVTAVMQSPRSGVDANNDGDGFDDQQSSSVECRRDPRTGTYSVVYMMHTDGLHQLNVLLRGHPIGGSPFAIQVSTGRDYSNLAAAPLFSFGGEGSGDGEFSRPWGVCCDKRGRIIVADRSNNRVQIFDATGHFILKFGQGGTGPGRFDRPAGVTSNSKCAIVVADKDNHRIQVFDADGTFLLRFGERGRNVGQFNYPWDVAADAEDRIAVSDTRNHRVQLFTAGGQFVRKFGFDNCLFYKHFDSPRGVAFLPDGQLIVTDFNNHRMVLVSMKDGNDMKFIGTEGEGDGCFRRPQGIDVDTEGHVLVADSRNDRLQVFGPDLRPMCVFGGSLRPPQPCAASGGGGMLVGAGQTPPDRMDRPCDVCVSPDGRVYVVDLGNNMVHVY